MIHPDGHGNGDVEKHQRGESVNAPGNGTADQKIHQQAEQGGHQQQNTKQNEEIAFGAGEQLFRRMGGVKGRRIRRPFFMRINGDGVAQGTLLFVMPQFNTAMDAIGNLGILLIITVHGNRDAHLHQGGQERPWQIGFVDVAGKGEPQFIAG